MGIGPSTKETSLHHFRDPLLDVVSEDTDLDLMGVMLVGSPDGNEDKLLVGTRAAIAAECMRADGVIVSCDGWGNSHVDYTNTMEQIGIRGIPAAGKAVRLRFRTGFSVLLPLHRRSHRRCGLRRKRCPGMDRILHLLT